MARVTVYLADHEKTALNHLAEQEYRAPHAQAALIIRNELERLGLLAGTSTTPLQISPVNVSEGFHGR